MPVHAQRINSLLASDKEHAFCRVERTRVRDARVYGAAVAEAAAEAARTSRVVRRRLKAY